MSSPSNINNAENNVNLISNNNNNPNNNNNNEEEDNNYIIIRFRQGNNQDETTIIINNSSNNSNSIPNINFSHPPYSLSAISISLLLIFLYFHPPPSTSTSIPITLWSISQKHQYFSLFTSNFLHSNFPQLFFNIFLLLLSFSLIEKHIGTISSWFLFISFLLINSLLSYLHKHILSYFSFDEYDSINTGLTPIIFIYFTFIHHISKSYEIFIWGFSSYIALIILKYVYNPFTVLLGVIGGYLCIWLNRKYVLLPKREWVCMFEKVFRMKYDITLCKGCVIVVYCLSKREKSIVDKYY